MKLDIWKVLNFDENVKNCFKSWVSYCGFKYLILKQLYCDLVMLIQQNFLWSLEFHEAKLLWCIRYNRGVVSLYEWREGLVDILRCLSELVCARMVELSLLFEEKGGVNIFAKKFALSLRAGMRKMGWCREVAAMIIRRGAFHAQKVELHTEVKLRKKVELRKKVLSGMEKYS